MLIEHERNEYHQTIAFIYYLKCLTKTEFKFPFTAVFNVYCCCTIHIQGHMDWSCHA